MIKTTVKQIQEGMSALQILTGCMIPAKAAYAVSKLINACNSELAHFETARKKIFTDAGAVIGPVTRQVDGKDVTNDEWTHADPEKMEEIKAQVVELQGAEAELNALPLDIEQFGSKDLPGGALVGLGWALKE